MKEIEKSLVKIDYIELKIIIRSKKNQINREFILRARVCERRTVKAITVI